MITDQLPFKQKFEESKDILILLGHTPTDDVVAAGLGLFSALSATGKNVHIACPTPLTSTVSALKAGDRVSSTLGNRNLVISLAVESRDSIDKVSYNLDESGKIFHLIVQPRKGQKPLASEQVSYSYSGMQADLVFILGAKSFQDIDHFYEAEKKSFETTTTVSVGLHSSSYAQHDVSDVELLSVCEVATSMLDRLGITINAAIATDFMIGIDSVTDKLQSTAVKPGTFETVARLMRAGGVRQQSSEAIPSLESQNVSSSGADTLKKPLADNPTPSDKGVAAEPNTKVPDEWLSPKIYKSSDSGSA